MRQYITFDDIVNHRFYHECEPARVVNVVGVNSGYDLELTLQFADGVKFAKVIPCVSVLPEIGDTVRYHYKRNCIY